jgi:acrylyl-CoA reductase (NADPH)
VAAIGLAGGAAVPSFTVIPFLLRGVSLLGIDSVMRPYDQRVEAWQRLVTDLPREKLESMISEHGLAEMPALGASILKGGVKGRVVVDTAR